jgi:hypothetical protein
MTASITLFAAASSATGQQLDDDLTLVSNQAPIPCQTAGTNAITLTQLTSTYPVAAYVALMQFAGVASGSNTGPATARLGSLAALNVYKDTGSGPVALVGGEIIVGNAFTLLYDPTLNTGAGGFHLFSSTGLSTTAINPSTIQLGTGSVLNRYLTSTIATTFSVFPPGTSQQSISALAGAQVNDAIQIGPPSLASLQGLVFSGYVPAAGSVALVVTNANTASITLAAGVFRLTAMG